MQFLKKNYEKIVLGAVVVIALGIVAFLPIMVSQENKKLDDLEKKVYDLVAKRFLSIFYPSAQFEVTTRITRVRKSAEAR